MNKTAKIARPSSDAQPADNIRERLIDVAARHFAEHGIKGSSQRAIQREVGVNNSTANYYFGSKDALYRAVVERALSPMQAIRIKGLENLPANLSRRDGAEALMEAYLGALLRQAATEAGYNYIRIVASLLLVVPDAAAEVIEERLTPVRELYVDKLESLYPEASRSRIYEVLRLAVGLTAMAPIRLGKTRLSKATISRLTHEVVTVSTLAFESLCGAQTQQAN